MLTEKSNTLIKSSFILGSAIILSKIAGFSMEMVLAMFYGAGVTTDAFVLVYSIPATLLIVVSSLTSGFIPMYYQVKTSTNFMRNIMTMLLIIGVLFSGVFTIYPEWIIRLFAARLPPDTFELSVFFTRYMVWSATLILFSEVYSAHLQIKSAFFAFGIQTVFRKITVIIGLILGALLEYNLFIALAPVVGNALCVLFLGWNCRKHGYVYKPYLDVRSHELKQLLILCGPVFFTTAINQINAIISRNFASSLPVGSISHLNFAFTITSIFTLAGGILITVLFPLMSKLAAEGNLDKLKNTLVTGILYTTVIMLPVSVGLFILAEPVVRILYQRGEFIDMDTFQTATILRMYAATVFAGSIIPLLMRGFHACRDTKTPAIQAFIATIVGIGLNFVFIRPFGAEGLALAYSLSSLLAVFLLLIFFSKKIGSLRLRSNLFEFMKIAIATVIMGIGTRYAMNFLPLMDVSVLHFILLCAALVTTAAIVYGGLLLLMRNKIAHEIIRKLMHR